MSKHEATTVEKFGIINISNEDPAIIREKLIAEGIITAETELSFLSMDDLGLTMDSPKEDVLEVIRDLIDIADEAQKDVLGTVATDDGLKTFDIRTLARPRDPGDGIHTVVVPSDMSEEEVTAYLHKTYPGYEIRVIESSESMTYDEAMESVKGSPGETIVIDEDHDRREVMAEITRSIVHTAEHLLGMDVTEPIAIIDDAVRRMQNDEISFKEYVRALMHATECCVPDLKGEGDRLIAEIEAAEARATAVPFPMIEAGRKHYALIDDVTDNALNTLAWFGFDRMVIDELTDDVDVFVRSYGDNVHSYIELDRDGGVSAFTIRPDLNAVYRERNDLAPGVIRSANSAVRDQYSLLTMLKPLGNMGGRDITIG